MKAVKGLYDGKHIKLLEPSPGLKPGLVIITFLDDDTTAEAIREYAADTEAFSFWKEEEDLYQEYLKKPDENR